MANIKNYGIKGIGSDVQFGKAGGKLSFANGEFLLSDLIKGAGSPIEGTHLADKNYVDGVAQGLSFKEAVRVATTENLLDYAVAGPIDGITVEVGDRILVKDQDDEAFNGIYVVNSNNDLVRSQDANDAGELVPGSYVFVAEGDINANTSWVLTIEPGAVEVDVTGLTWTIFGRAGEVTGGVGIDITGSIASTDFSDFALVDTVTGSEELALVGNQRATINDMINDLDIVRATTANGILTKIGDDQYAARTTASSVASGFQGISIVDADGVNGDPTFGLTIDGLDVFAGTNGPDATDVLVLFDGQDNVKVGVDALLADRNVTILPGGTGFLHEDAGVVSNGFISANGNNAELGITVTGANTSNPTIGFSIAGLGAIAQQDLDISDELFVRASTGDNQKVSFGDLKANILGDVTANSISEGDSSITVTDDGIGVLDFVADGVSALSIGVDRIDAKVGLFGTGANFSGNIIGDNISSNGGIRVGNVSGSILSTDIDGLVAPTTFVDGGGVDISYTADHLLTSKLEFETLSTATVAGAHELAVKNTGGDNAHYKYTVDDLKAYVTGDLVSNEISADNSRITVNDGGDDGVLEFVVDATSALTINATGINATVDLVGEGATFSGLEVTGDTTLAGLEAGATTLGATGVTGGLVADTASASDLAVDGGVVFADATGKLMDDATFTFDGTTLSVPELDAGTLTGDIALDQVQGAATLVTFGGGDGSLTTDADFAYDELNNVLSVGTFAIHGTNQTITGTSVDADISLIPNGDGNVIIGASGAGEIRADSNQALTVGTDGTALLKLEGIDIVLGSSNGTTNYAQFTGGSQTNHLVVSASDTTVELDDALGTIGIAFESGKLKVLNQAAADYATGLAQNDIPNVQYVDDAITNAVTPGALGSIVVNGVDLSVDTVLGTLPASVTVLSVRMNVILGGTGGVVVQGSSVLMAAEENDPTETGVYIAEIWSNEDADQEISMVSGASTGEADFIIEYRYN